ncbi:DUF389 domain-containing protein [Prauserella alba]|nr:DUF389 domain-containing protein [Prauserella alba]MCP2182924.1 putative hydrophobic domain-containing protein [Prauserella alba]
MMQLRVLCPSEDSAAVIDLLGAEPGVTHLAVAVGAGRQPAGDVMEAVIAREVAEDVLQRLVELGVDRRGEVSLHSVDTMLSDTADAAERSLPGHDADAVVWDELVATTGEESQLNRVFLGFLTIACLLAAVGVLTDSPITIVGAMVVSPDFGPVAALAVATVGRRRDLAARAGIALGVGFPAVILATIGCALLATAVGLYDPSRLDDLRQAAFIYQIGPYSVIVALLAGAAGMLALTSEKSGVLIGVFISVVTVPAAGYAALAAVAGDWMRCGEAIGQLVINLAGLTVAGVVVLALRRRHIVPGSGAVTHPLRRGRQRRPR